MKYVWFQRRIFLWLHQRRWRLGWSCDRTLRKGAGFWCRSTGWRTISSTAYFTLLHITNNFQDSQVLLYHRGKWCVTVEGEGVLNVLLVERYGKKIMPWTKMCQMNNQGCSGNLIQWAERVRVISSSSHSEPAMYRVIERNFGRTVAEHTTSMHTCSSISRTKYQERMP